MKAVYLTHHPNCIGSPVPVPQIPGIETPHVTGLKNSQEFGHHMDHSLHQQF